MIPRSRLTLGAVVAVAAISSGAVLARLAGEAHPLAIAAWRLGLASLVLVPWAMLRGGWRRVTRADVLRSVASGAALAVHFGLWITSLTQTSVASSVLFVTLHPLFVGVAAAALYNEPLTKNLTFGIAASTLGGLLLSIGDLRLGDGSWVGDLLALGGGLAAAVYFLIGRRARIRMPLVEYTAIAYGSATLLLLAACVFGGIRLHGYSQATFGALLLLALIPQLVGHSTLNWALRYLPAARVSLLVLAEPIGAGVLAFTLFGEVPTWLGGLGAAIILLGLFVAGRRKESVHG
ncbi:MAG: DMT family transporter [Candidatus Bipolaricaulota bacterium]